MALYFSNPPETLSSFPFLPEPPSITPALSSAASQKILIEDHVTPSVEEDQDIGIGRVVDDKVAEMRQRDSEADYFTELILKIDDQAEGSEGGSERGYEDFEQSTEEEPRYLHEQPCSQPLPQNVNSAEIALYKDQQETESAAGSSASFTSCIETTATVETPSQHLRSFDFSERIIPSPPPKQPIVLRYFYPIDPVTLIQQQDPVYNDPQYPIVKPIEEWPPPELVEWRKGKRKRVNHDGEARTNSKKKRWVDQSSGDEYIDGSMRPAKRVRWKSVDDVSFFENLSSVTVDIRNKPFISLPTEASVDLSSYRSITIPPLSPAPSDDEETLPLGRGMRRRRTPGLSLRLAEGHEHRNFSRASSTSVSLPSKKVAFKTEVKRPVSTTRKKEMMLSSASSLGRCCHQCRRSHSIPPAPKMKCSFIKSDGQTCVLQYCISCVKTRYAEPFDPSAKMWVCPFCRDICNCSICLRKQGFGYIFDSPAALEIRKPPPRRSKKRGKAAKLSMPSGKDATETDVSEGMVKKKPSLREWLARQGVVTGSTAWMAQRRGEGARFVIGRSPSPGMDSSYVPVERCEFLKQSGNEEDQMEEGGITPDIALTKQEQVVEVTPGPTASPATLKPPASPSGYDVFAQSNYPEKRLFIGKMLRRKRSDVAQKEDKDVIVVPSQPRSSTDVPIVEGPIDDAEDSPKHDCPGVLQPSFTKPTENETPSSQQTQHGLTREPVSEPDRVHTPEPSSSYPTITSLSTPQSTPTSYDIHARSRFHPFRSLLDLSPAAEQMYHTGLNARGMELARQLEGKNDSTGKPEIMSSLIGGVIPGAPVFSAATSPARHPQNPAVGEYAQSLSSQGDDGASKGIYGGIVAPDPVIDSWLLTDEFDKDGDYEMEDIDAVEEIHFDEEGANDNSCNGILTSTHQTNLGGTSTISSVNDG